MLRNLDIFPKFKAGYAKETTQGAVIALSCIGAMAVLFVVNLVEYLSTPARQMLVVDESPIPATWGGTVDFNNLAAVDLHFDIVFPGLPCVMMFIGVADSFGRLHGDAIVRSKLRRLDHSGRELKLDKPSFSATAGGKCGSCYGMGGLGECCATCKDVRHAFKARGFAPPPLAVTEQCRGKGQDWETAKREQCHVTGTVVVPPTKGTVYFAPGSNFADNGVHVQEYGKLGIRVEDFNVSHHVKEFYIGDKPQKFPAGAKAQTVKGRHKFSYSLKALRKVRGGAEEFVSTLSAHDHPRQGKSTKFPGVYFDYELSPVVIQEKRDKSLPRFLVNTMGILGGIFAIGTVIDRLLTPRKTAAEVIA